MPAYVVGQISEILNKNGKILNNSKILLMGVAYKNDISDMRESPAIDITELLLEKKVDVSYFDPFVKKFSVFGKAINKEDETVIESEEPSDEELSQAVNKEKETVIASNFYENKKTYQKSLYTVRQAPLEPINVRNLCFSFYEQNIKNHTNSSLLSMST